MWIRAAEVHQYDCLVALIRSKACFFSSLPQLSHCARFLSTTQLPTFYFSIPFFTLFFFLASFLLDWLFTTYSSRLSVLLAYKCVLDVLVLLISDTQLLSLVFSWGRSTYRILFIFHQHIPRMSIGPSSTTSSSALTHWSHTVIWHYFRVLPTHLSKLIVQFENAYTPILWQFPKQWSNT